MPAFFSSEIQGELNNLPGFPRAEEFQLGNVLNAIAVPDPATQGQVNLTIHVQTTANGGSDATGDGSSVATAFATPQKAYDSIVRLATPGWYQIQCGAGTFDTPVLDKVVASGTYVAFVGNLDTDPAATIEFGVTPTFVAVGSQAVRRRANIGAYGFTVNNQTHWLQLDYGSGFPTFGGAVAPSATPNLDAPQPRFSFFNTTALRPFETIFATSTVGGTFYPFPGRDTIAFHGIRVTGAVATKYENISFFGCDLRNGSMYKNSWVDSAHDGGTFHGVSSMGAVVAGNVTFIETGFINNAIAAQIALTGVTYSINSTQLLVSGGVGGVDFEGAGDGFLLAQGNLTIIEDIFVEATRAEFMLLNKNSSCEIVGTDVDGATTGDCVLVQRGSHVIGFEAACAGNLTSSGGDEIVLGGLAGPTFALGLPLSDVAAAAAAVQLCSGT